MSYIQALKQEYAARKLRKQGKLASVEVIERIPAYQKGYGLLHTS